MSIRHNATTREIIDTGREIWGDLPILTVPHAAAVLSKITGDLSAQARSIHEGRGYDATEVQKELGNLVATALRAIEDLGFSAHRALVLALDAQQAYVERMSDRR